jgi:flagellar basal body rod protein FlgB
MPRTMIDNSEIQALARFLDVNARRSEIITSNLANIDTPGYGLRVTEVLTGGQSPGQPQ